MNPMILSGVKHTYSCNPAIPRNLKFPARVMYHKGDIEKNLECYLLARFSYGKNKEHSDILTITAGISFTTRLQYSGTRDKNKKHIPHKEDPHAD